MTTTIQDKAIEIGTGYFDRVMNSITEGESSVEALADSTEKAQF